MLCIIDFVCWVAVVSFVAAFLLGLSVKWGWLEWLQTHAPNDFFNRMFNCKFCCSFHVSMFISLIVCFATGHWILLAVPICSTVIARELW